jgi:hypothetical protein
MELKVAESKRGGGPTAIDLDDTTIQALCIRPSWLLARFPTFGLC